MNRSTDHLALPSLYQQYFGAEPYATLPAEVQTFHASRGELHLTGEVTVEGAASWPGTVARIAMRLPKPAARLPFSFAASCGSHAERWTRVFPSGRFSSTLSLRGGYLTEALGFIRLWFKLEASSGKLNMTLSHMTCAGIRIPAWLTPRVHAQERGAHGRFLFDIDVAWQNGKRIIAYRGYLDLAHKEVSA